MEIITAFQTYFGNSFTEWSSVAQVRQKFCCKLLEIALQAVSQFALQWT